MSAGTPAQITLRGETVEVTGEGLKTRPLRLFFRGVLGAQLTDAGWRLPTRGTDGSALIVRIARRLEQAGCGVSTESDQVDRVLAHEMERMRSFERARAAGAVLLGLREDAAVELPDRDELLARIEQFGWNTAERRLLDHQVDGFRHAMTAVNAANFSVPGAGKTATALAVIAGHLAFDNIDLALVVGPLSAFRPWEREAAIALPCKLEVHRVRGMTRPERARFYERTQPGQLLLTTYASLASDRYEVERLCRRHRVMLIADESHRAKRFRGGQWAPALNQVARAARFRMILSGTPMPQGPTDLWSQFNILWPCEEATGSRLSFKARTEASFEGVIRSLEPFFTRTPKSSLGLKPTVIHRAEVELAPVQREVYELIESRFRQAIPDAGSWQDKLDALRRARPIRLIQAASNPDLLNEIDGFFEMPPLEAPSGTLMQRLYSYRHHGELPAKFDWALTKLKELRDADEKCVVWTTFIRNIDQFTALGRNRLDAPIYSVDGRVPVADDGAGVSTEEIDETREQRIDAFLDHQGCSVLVANPAACAESISLHSACHTAIYLDRTHDCARWLQSIDRIHRLGLPADVTVEIWVPEVVFDGAATIDGLVDASLKRKSATMTMLLEGAELRAAQAPDEDTLDVAEGDRQDLESLLRYLIGEQ